MRKTSGGKRIFWGVIVLLFIGAAIAFYLFLHFKNPGKGPVERIAHYAVPQPESVVDIPLDISLSRISEALRKKIGHLHFDLATDLQVGGKERNDRRIEKGKTARTLPIVVTLDFVLQSLNLTAVGNQLTAKVSYDIQFQARIDNAGKTVLASCGLDNEKPRVDFTLVSKFALAPSGDVVLSNKQWDLKWQKPCTVTMFNVSVEDLLKREALKTKFDAVIDNVVTNKIPEAIDIIPILHKTWVGLQLPIRLGSDLSLTLHPKDVMLNALTGDGKTVRTEITALCSPQLTAGKADTIPPVPVSLVEGLKHNDSIRFYLTTAMTMAKLNELVNTKLKKKEFPAGRVTVKIGKILAYQSDSFVVFKVRLSKPFFGVIYLKGKPVYDPDAQGIDFDKFDYSVETEEMLGKLTTLVVNPLNLRQAIVTQLKKVTDKTLGRVMDKYNDFSRDLKNAITISGGLKQVRPIEMFVSDNQILLLSEVTGVLTVEVK